MIVADTDVLIDFLRGKGAAEAVARALETGELATTAITRFELMAGARGQRQRQATLDLLSALPTLPLGEAAAERAAEIRQSLEREGQGIGMADCLVAGITLEHGGALLTRNHRHFARVAALRLHPSAEG